MKTHILAPFAVIVLWLGLSSVWMGQTGSTWASNAATTDNPASTAMPMGPVMIDLTLRAPLGPVMTELMPVPVTAAPTDPPTAAAPSLAPNPSVTSTPSAAPLVASTDETLARMEALEARLSQALQALEQRDGNGSQDASTVQGPSFLAMIAKVGSSAPVIGFLVMLLLALAVAARGRPLIGSVATHGLRDTIHRLTAPAPDAAGLPQSGTSPPASGLDAKRRIYGQTITHIQPNGQPLHAGVFEENQVRAAAGLTLALAAVAFAYAAVGKVYLPIQTVTTLFFVEFLIRVTWGITRSPLGLLAGWMTLRGTPQWVSAKPKRFAWSLGLGMSLAMMIITNSGIRGPLPLTICLICLTLMWLEAVLGLCLGCEMHRYLVRRGWMQPDKDYEICANGACTVQPQPLFAR